MATAADRGKGIGNPDEIAIGLSSDEEEGSVPATAAPATPATANPSGAVTNPDKITLSMSSSDEEKAG